MTKLNTKMWKFFKKIITVSVHMWSIIIYSLITGSKSDLQVVDHECEAIVGIS